MTTMMPFPLSTSYESVSLLPKVRASAAPRAESISGARIAALEGQLDTIATENERLDEALASIQMMVDARGWTEVGYTTQSIDGMNLEIAKDSSTQLREMVVGNPFMKRGSQLRIMYVWAAGVDFSCLGSALPDQVANRMKSARNRRYIFSADAQEELERAAFTDGNIFLLGDVTTKDFQRVPLEEITGDLRNPNNNEEIWAYRREWNSSQVSGDVKTTVRWYYTDIFTGTKKRTIEVGGKTESFDNKYVMLDKSFNRQIGWAYGVPDGLPSLVWARLYKDFLYNGVITAKALATLVFKVTSGSAKGARNAAVEVALPGATGSTASMAGGNDLQALSTAGKGYDFDAGRPIAAAIAAGVEVSLVALLSDPGAGGGSYGTAQTLDAPARATGEMRRKTWEEYFERIFRFMGLPESKELQITWKELSDGQIQRVLQAWTLTHNTGLFAPDIIQQGIASAMEIINPGDVPEGYLLPNNEESLGRKDIDRDGEDGDGDANDDDSNQDPSATAGTGQGQSGPAGSLGNDHSTDEE